MELLNFLIWYTVQALSTPLSTYTIGHRERIKYPWSLLASVSFDSLTATTTMSYSNSPVSSSHLQRSKFKEPLFIQPPMPNVDPQGDVSRFSPDSPPLPFRSPSPHSGSSHRLHLRSFSPIGRSFSPIPLGGKSFRGREKERERDVEAAVPAPSSSSPELGRGLKDRFTRFFFGVRTQPKEFMIPLQHPSHSHTDLPSLSEWPPLHISERCTCYYDIVPEKERKRRNRCIWFWIFIILLYLLVSSTFSLARVISLPHISSSTPSSNTTSENPGNLNIQQCISQYQLNAPSSPPSYPCSTCLPLLSPASPPPPNTLNTLSAADNQSASNAIQFCALKSVFDASASAGQASLKGGNWVQDVKFCAWSGVTCDGSGSVGSLQLITPSVPSILPPSLSFLRALTVIRVIGDTQNPSGILPQAYANFTSLSTLHLESTNLQGPLTDIFSSGANGVKTLQLLKNAGMGGTLPNGVFGSSLQNLQINNQPLDGSTLQSITSSTTLQRNLQLLDLSSTQLNTTLPSQISAFQSLTELQFDNTNLQSQLPSSFPRTLKVLSLNGNPELGSGGVGGVCALAVQGGLGGGCTLGGSGLSAPSGGCGRCSF